MDQAVYDRTAADIDNIIGLEHVNTTIDDQRLATLFYVVGLGFTRDPYMSVGDENMWINLGRQQFHLPTRGKPQVLRGHVGVVVPDLGRAEEAARERAPEARRNALLVRREERPHRDHLPVGQRHPRLRAAGAVRRHEARHAVRRADGAARRRGRHRALLPAGIRRQGEGRGGRRHRSLRAQPEDDLPRDRRRHPAVRRPPYRDLHRGFLRAAPVPAEARASSPRRATRTSIASRTSSIRRTASSSSSSSTRCAACTHPMYGRPFVNRNPAQMQRTYVRGYDAFVGDK